MSLLHLGLDIGSTTVKAVVLDEDDRLIFSRYSRHFADIRTAASQLVDEIREKYLGSLFTVSVAGSGALELAKGMDVPFTQELIACSTSIGRYLPDVDVCIELGGEDAKLTFFDASGADQRMNETCAGGTGAFIDQMAALLGTDAAGLNELAKKHKTIYPIASRCGVFAKTDIQPLLSDGAAREDIAASIFQAIVNQTVSGLACGRRISGNVAFLGGPLYFLSELRVRFAETLGLTPEQCIFPENPHLFVAIGAAISGKKGAVLDMEVLRERAALFFNTPKKDSVSILPALFLSEEERAAFKERHGRGRVVRRPLDDYSGDAYLGIDVGSTTTKVVLIGSQGELLFSSYTSSGGGEPLKTVRSVLEKLYAAMPACVTIKSSGVTGYGEKLVQAALGVDLGEVETVAHARAAEFVLPGVEFIIDIGGQDMKCLGVEQGVVKRVVLNEACSSGCGSFLQGFAESLDMSVQDFALEAEKSMIPVDLGSRCTVFMNSRVRQVQKEGASVRDISAGLVYSVVRNALYKVLKIKNLDELGSRIVVQGGSFKNDALLRAFEILTGREVVRPEIPELMGAFGAALLARDRFNGGMSGLISSEQLKTFDAKTSTRRCDGCGNRCVLTTTRFEDGRRYLSGNRCEQGNPVDKKGALPPNLFEKKYERLFGYTPLDAAQASRGTIGMPRVLNMYEDYPFWFTFLTKLGFRVELSGRTPDENLGIDTIPSQTVCYPAKLAHRHVADLLAHGVTRIFYPILQRSRKEFADAHQNFNCPVVTGYPDVLFLNMDDLRKPGVTFLHPTVALDHKKNAADALHEAFADCGAGRGEVERALAAAYAEQVNFKKEVAAMGREALAYVREKGVVGVVLAGHPYHLDPAVNHGIPELINRYDVAVFTEDSICGRAAELSENPGVDVVDQWVYHSRLYRAAMVLARYREFQNVEMVQLNSFGCGLDAISADQAAALLERCGRLHTLIKIDEGKNNGAVRIRVRSLLAAVKMKKKTLGQAPDSAVPTAPKIAPPGAVADRTILCPPLSSHHFQFMETVMESAGLNLKVLPEGSRSAIELGLRYVNNDACYPAILVVGQFLQALQGGEYDPDTTDCLYAQTGGACRASNYVPILRRALDAAGYPQVRILAANAQANKGAEPFTLPLKTYWRALLGLEYGDLLMRLVLRTRPYEKTAGAANALYELWSARARANVREGSWRVFKEHARNMAADFAALPVLGIAKPKVGIVGEILVKYHANANERLVEIIESEGGEAVVPDLANFLYYCLFDPIYAQQKLSGTWRGRLVGEFGIKVLDCMRRPLESALKNRRFGGFQRIDEMAKEASSMVSIANQAGEGWLLTAEMMLLIESGVKNVLCIQPFACLPNHVTGKGVIKELKRRYAGANILALDYDSSVSTVNQLNRIKLLMATAR